MKKFLWMIAPLTIFCSCGPGLKEYKASFRATNNHDQNLIVSLKMQRKSSSDQCKPHKKWIQKSFTVYPGQSLQDKIIWNCDNKPKGSVEYVLTGEKIANAATLQLERPLQQDLPIQYLTSAYQTKTGVRTVTDPYVQTDKQPTLENLLKDPVRGKNGQIQILSPPGITVRRIKIPKGAFLNAAPLDTLPKDAVVRHDHIEFPPVQAEIRDYTVGRVDEKSAAIACKHGQCTIQKL